MKVFKDFNNISDKLRPRILKKGEVVLYRYLKGVPNTDHDYEARKKRPIVYPEYDVLRLQDRIFDPYKGTHGEFVDIGAPLTVEKGEVTRCKRFEFAATENDGQWAITGGSIEAQEMFEILELMNCNKSNPNRDETVTPWFEVIDTVAEAKARNKKRDILSEAIVFAANMSAGEKVQFAAGMGWDETAHPEVIEDQIKEMVHTSPETFLKYVVNEKSLGEKGILKQALTRGLISFDTVGHKFLWPESNTTIATLERVEGKDPIELFHDWIVTSKNGQNIFKSIQTKLNNAIKDARKDKEGEV